MTLSKTQSFLLLVLPSPWSSCLTRGHMFAVAGSDSPWRPDQVKQIRGLFLILPENDRSLSQMVCYNPPMCQWTELVTYIYMQEKWGHCDWQGKRADRPTPKLEFHQQRKEENYFWGGNRVPGLPRRFSGKESTSQCRRCRFYLLFRKISYIRKWQPLQ